MKIYLAILLGVLLAMPAGLAAEMITRSAQEEINLGDTLDVTITVGNPTQANLNLKISEQIPSDVVFIDPSEPTKIEQHDALTVNILEWDITVPSGGTKSITYKIQPKALGQYSTPPTEVKDKTTNEFYSSFSDLLVMVNCVPDGTCTEDENYLNCEADCTTAAEDGICNSELDGACDPDCSFDPDCDGTTSSSLIMYIIGGVVLVIIVVLVILVMKKKSQQSL